MHAKIKKHNKNNEKNTFMWGGDENMTVFGRVLIRSYIPIPTKLRHRFEFSAVNHSDNAGLYLRELSLSDHNQITGGFHEANEQFVRTIHDLLTLVVSRQRGKAGQWPD
ncbi:MAG: hypothetical protein P8045_09765 [Candidatus Thiodiazotropha sp.]